MFAEMASAADWSGADASVATASCADGLAGVGGRRGLASQATRSAETAVAAAARRMRLPPKRQIHPGPGKPGTSRGGRTDVSSSGCRLVSRRLRPATHCFRYAPRLRDAAARSIRRLGVEDFRDRADAEVVAIVRAPRRE